MYFTSKRSGGFPGTGRALALWLLMMGLAACAGSPGGADADAGPGDADAGYEPGDGGDQQIADGDGAGEGDEPIVLRLEAVLPSRGPVQGGTWVNIIGSGFVEGIADSPFGVRDVTSVTFGDNPALDLEVVRDDMISVRTPANPPGAVKVAVENPNGRVELPAAFNYYDQVIVDEVVPVHLAAGGGTALSVSGSGFSPDTTLLVGGRQAAAVQVPDQFTVTALAPPGPAGAADVEVINRNGRVLLYRAVTFHPQPELESVIPAGGPSAGGTAVQVRGSGFDQFTQLFFGSQELLPSFSGSTSLDAVTRPTAVGPVTVRVQNPVAGDDLPAGFVFLPPPQGSLNLVAVSPAVGPSAGGVEVWLAGEGFAGGIDEVRFGSQVATAVTVTDDRLARVELPAGQPGTVAVTVTTSSGQATAPGAFRYFEPLKITSIEPSQGPAGGGGEVTLHGAGFHEGMSASLGGVAIGDLQVLGPDEIRGTLPPGSAGPVDVVVADSDSRARLAAGFTYLEDLGLVRVEPDNGAQAGGTYVTVYGSGFAPGLRVWFGEQEGTVVQVLGPATFTARTPPGVPGEVTVAVELDGQRRELPAGFAYFDPTNDRGGASGGPLSGSFNVTVLDGTWVRYGEPLAEARVIIDQPPLEALTDERGQVTFSGPALVKALTVTVTKDGYEAVSVVGLNAANLTLYLYPNVQEPIQTQPGQIKVADLSGRVFGFKDVPGLPSGPDVSLQARVNLTAWSLYSVPPYGGAPQGQVIERDGGSYSYTLRLGNYSVYAVFGAYDAASDEFTPALLGVRRGITLMSEEPVTDQDIILSTALDSSVPVHLVDPPLPPSGGEPSYSVYASLDLGYDGIVYLGSDESSGTELVLRHLPEAAGEAFLLVGLASDGGSYPLSYVFRRQEGDLAAGVDVGPFLGFIDILNPPPDGELEQGRLHWQMPGQQPALYQVLIETADLIPAILWRVIVPGGVNQVALPEQVLAELPRGEPLLLLVYAANSPRFRFDRFNYTQLSTSRWTAYSVQLATFTIP